MTDIVIQWNNVLLAAIRVAGGPPCPIVRAGAMMHAAMNDAINSIEKTHQPYAISLPTPIGASAEAAIAYAAHRVIRSIYPAQTAAFDAALAQSLANLGPQTKATDIDNGRILGEAIGNAMIARRTKDGSENMDPYVSGSNPGDWRPTGSGDAASRNWPKVQPFTMSTGSQFRPTRPGGYATKPELLCSPEYLAQFNEVKRLGSKNASDRTPEQTEIAFFWANDLDGASKLPGQLFGMTQVVAEQRKLSLFENARLFALVALALADAGIVAWDAKYSTDLDLWLPETAVRLADTDGNPATVADPNWEPLGTSK